ncbi:uncharacterized protein V6R79_001224 [Siganus canaliculatus]
MADVGACSSRTWPTLRLTERGAGRSSQMDVGLRRRGTGSGRSRWRRENRNLSGIFWNHILTQRQLLLWPPAAERHESASELDYCDLKAGLLCQAVTEPPQTSVRSSSRTLPERNAAFSGEAFRGGSTLHSWLSETLLHQEPLSCRLMFSDSNSESSGLFPA